MIRSKKNALQLAAEEMYSYSTNDVKTNRYQFSKLVERNKELLNPIIVVCPNFDVLIAHFLVLRFGFKVQSVDTPISDCTEEDCRRIGRSIAPMLREQQTGEGALEAWR